MKTLKDKYNPKEFEDTLYEEWEKKGISNRVWTRRKKVIAL